MKSILFTFIISMGMICCNKKEAQFISSYNASDAVFETFVTKDMLVGATLEEYCKTVYPMYAYGEMIHKSENFYVIRLSDRQKLSERNLHLVYDFTLQKDTSHIYTVTYAIQSFHNDGD